MGLLDNFVNFAGTDQGIGLAQGLLSANGSQGIAAGLAGMQQAKKQQQEFALRKQMHDAQMQEIQAQAMHRKAQADQFMQERARQEGIQNGLSSLFGGGVNPGSIGFPDAGGVPMTSQAQVQTPSTAGPVRFDAIRAATQFRMRPEEIEKYARLADLGRAEVARTVEGKDAQGRPVTLQYDKYGNQVGQGVEQWKAPIQVSQGDRQTFADPVSLKALGSFSINQSPDSAASNAISIRGQNMTDARQREANSIQQNAQRTQLFQTPEGILAVDKGTRQASQVMIGGKPVRGEDAMKKSAGANNVLALIDQAEKLLPGATGSIAGAGVDYLASGVGMATSGAQKTAQLKAIEGALISSMPRMEGPQSDADRKLYQLAAGDIANPMAPVKSRQAALKTIREIQNRYASPGAAGGPDINALLEKYAK